MQQFLQVLIWLLLSRSTEPLNWQDFEREMRQNGRIVGRSAEPVEATYTAPATPASSSVGASTSTTSSLKPASTVTPETDLSGYTDAFAAQEAASQKRLMGFYTSLSDPNVERCKDITKLLPQCSQW